ncbi:MAG: hypothetical protein QOE82_1695 [Thermoanaerobaculia bacterium]|jgi:hypothetical protein|nr:hypothetical protein [Thermoanaerobaculia bacterium]
MPQIVLDPADKTAVGTWKAPGAIPPQLRSFGRFPDVTQWRAGDLLLVSAVKPPFFSQQIINAQQSGGYAADDARWHHAAIYVGRSNVCEALTNGVAHGPIYKYVGSHLLRVRRDPLFTPDDGWQLAMEAMTNLRTSYSFGAIASLLRKARRGFWNRPSNPSPLPDRAVICSKLFADAYSITTERVMGNSVAEEVTPAFLSATNKLIDVPMYWAQIV